LRRTNPSRQFRFALILAVTAVALRITRFARACAAMPVRDTLDRAYRAWIGFT
jgi:hypothetical protein